MTGGRLLWEPRTNKMVQSASAVFPQFQSSNKGCLSSAKGSLAHVLNEMLLGEVPMEKYFDAENVAINLLILAKDVSIPGHLGQALSGLHWEEWEKACQAELDQMAAREVWYAIAKNLGMKTIGH
ncbi:hypothetical protein O181_019559 [Austropuccinia psidii MF-1]|uniref:Uncharacterized protein n=1 Tax=Austropuccinia psidii MF-1 TaxID=1389203 RepID=A0A9Q3GUV0_9BASI|nr:hypothetical protein [Austropuccinia psidii MF-1]